MQINMNRVAVALVVVAAALASPSLRADVKTQEKTLTTMEGMPKMMTMFGGAPKEVISTIAVKGNRKLTMNDTMGTIIDLSEQKVYTLDVKKKEYRVATFAEIKAQYEKAMADLQKQMSQMKPEDKQQMEQMQSQAQNQQQMVFDTTVEETPNRHPTIAGHETREVVTTVTAHQQGQTLEEGGGMVFTTTSLIAPKIAALDEVAAFDMKYAMALFGDGSMMAMQQQMMQITAMFPSMKDMQAKARAASEKLTGTTLMSSTVFETVMSNDQMKASQDAQQKQGGGMPSMSPAGFLAKKMAPKPGPVEQRKKITTTTREVITLETTATDADVAIPAGFKEKK